MAEIIAGGVSFPPALSLSFKNRGWMQSGGGKGLGFGVGDRIRVCVIRIDRGGGGGGVVIAAVVDPCGQ